MYLYNNKKIITASAPSSRRLTVLDTIRGITLLNMILYHFLWDLVYIAGIGIKWYTGRGAHIWQQCICWTFIFLSGFCWSLGRRHLKRGLTVCLSGGLVTIVTLIFMPGNRVIFGILTLLGSSMLLMIPLDAILSKVKSFTGMTLLFAASGLLFVTLLHAAGGRLSGFASVWIGNAYWLSAYMGFPTPDFYSTDYFPLIPWFLLFVSGYLFYRMCAYKGYLKAPFWLKNLCPPLSFMGRHSLIIYMLHQPVLYAITMYIIR